MEEYMAMIKAFAGTFTIDGYLPCQGQLLSIAQYNALYALVGNTYGGDGRSTFALPDLRGRAPIGIGPLPGGSNYSLGQSGGSESVTLNQAQMPMHTHAVTATSTLYAEGEGGDQSSPKNNLLGTYSDLYVLPTESDNVAMSNQAISTSVTIGMAGGSQPVSVLSPYLAINYQICIQGIFPSRA